MTISDALLLSSIIIFLYVTVLFVVSLKLRRNDIADVGWGIGVLLVGLVGYVIQGNSSQFSSLILLLVTVWAVRLSFRIFVRNSKKSEDMRYKQWRDTWGRWFYVRSYLQVYLLQGALMLLVGYPLLHAVVFGGEGSIDLITTVGVGIWCFGFVFEAVSDYQLDTFLANTNNKGKLMRSGLWKYSRHPNYFGEVLMWWGIACSTVFLPYGMYTLISPFVITFLILKVSGIPMLEAHMRSHPDYESYASTTSVFIPLPPKKLV